MSGLLSNIESGVSGAATNFGNSLTNQVSNFASSLNPFGNNGSVVSNMPTFPPVYSSDSPSSFNTNYVLHLFGTDESNNTIDVMASLPEHFSFHLSADWQPLLHNPSLAGALGSIVQDARYAGTIAKDVFGISDYSQSATAQIYNATTPLDLAFPFVFNAVYDPTSEVMEQIQSLMSLVSPSIFHGILRNPGPTVYQMLNNTGYKISLRIGNAIMFPNILVTGVSPMFDVMCHKEGDFISAQVDVSFRTTTILTKQDIAVLFPNVTAAQVAAQPQAVQAAPGTQASRQGNTPYSGS